MKIKSGIIYIAVLIVLMVSCQSSTKKDKADAFTNWALSNTTEIQLHEDPDTLSDLGLLKTIIGNANVVCLGESRHDIREQFLLKNQIIQYLVEEMNFRTFVLEASLPYSNKINDYIKSGNGNIDEIMSNMPGWFLWDTEEMKSLIIWMRNFNKHCSEKDKISFGGIDIVAPNNAIEQIFVYLQKVDPILFQEIQKINLARELIVDENWPLTLQNYSELSTDVRQNIAKAYQSLHENIKNKEDEYITASSDTAYNWIKQLAFCAMEANRMFSANNRLETGLIRDSAMAQNSLWMFEHLSKEKKTIIWAHNVHISKGPFYMTGEQEEIRGMGYLLSQEWKDNMISIGASFNKGIFQEEQRTFKPASEESIDGRLAGLNLPYFLINLRGKTSSNEVINWLNAANTIAGQEFEMRCSPASSYDALFFTDNITKVRYNPITKERIYP